MPTIILQNILALSNNIILVLKLRKFDTLNAAHGCHCFTLYKNKNYHGNLAAPHV